MSYKEDIKEFLFSNEMNINMYDNKIYIGNYEKISHFDFNEIAVKGKEKKVVVIGKDLVISKLLKDEVLITGLITRIDIR